MPYTIRTSSPDSVGVGQPDMSPTTYDDAVARCEALETSGARGVKLRWRSPHERWWRRYPWKLDTIVERFAADYDDLTIADLERRLGAQQAWPVEVILGLAEYERQHKGRVGALELLEAHVRGGFWPIER